MRSRGDSRSPGVLRPPNKGSLTNVGENAVPVRLFYLEELMGLGSASFRL